MSPEQSQPSQQSTEGNRNVITDGSVVDSVIITGDGNTVIVPPPQFNPAKPWPPKVTGHEWDPRLWWEWLVDKRRRLVTLLLVLILIWICISTLFTIPPFQYRPVWHWKQFYGEGAWRLTATADSLYVTGRNPQKGCSATAPRGLWQLRKTDVAWQEIKLPVEVPNAQDCQQFAAIYDLAVSPLNPQILYVATDEKGLLRSQDGGKTWKVLESSGRDQLGALLKVAISPQNPELVVVIINGGGIYRSNNGGDTWQALDQQTGDGSSCKNGSFLLTKRLSAKTLLMNATFLVAGTAQPVTLNATNEPPGLYMSQDGGNCWHKVDDSVGQLEFFNLSYVPDAVDKTKGTLLFLAKDWKQHGQENSLGLWGLDLALNEPTQKIIWKTSATVTALYARREEEQIHWYVADKWGKIFTSTTDRSPNDYDVLPWLNRCIGCSVDLAPNPFENLSAPPLYLADDRVWQLASGPWWRLLWAGG